jgi:hypothetical protein
MAPVRVDPFAISRIPDAENGILPFAPCGILRISFVGWIGHVQISRLSRARLRAQGMPVAAPRAAAGTFGMAGQ